MGQTQHNLRNACFNQKESQKVQSHGSTRYQFQEAEGDKTITSKLYVEMQSTMRHVEQTSEKDPVSPTCKRQVPKVKVTRIDEPILIAESQARQSELNK